MSDTTPTAGQAIAAEWIYKHVYEFRLEAESELAAAIDAAIAQARREGTKAAHAAVAAVIAREGGVAPYGLAARIERAIGGLLLPSAPAAAQPPDLAREPAEARAGCPECRGKGWVLHPDPDARTLEPCGCTIAAADGEQRGEGGEP